MLTQSASAATSAILYRTVEVADFVQGFEALNK
jgi:hypothetical protein